MQNKIINHSSSQLCRSKSNGKNLPALVWKPRIAICCTRDGNPALELEVGKLVRNDRMTDVELEELGVGASALRRTGTTDRAVDRANISFVPLDV